MVDKKNETGHFQQYKKILLEIIHQVLPGCKVYLIGSRARGEHSSGADIDLVLDLGQPIERQKIFLIQDDIEETTIPLFVDIVDLHTASDEFKKEVERDGVLWE
ncbi:MAG: nucleotidyltransferase domain-containing protein [bacterium]